MAKDEKKITEIMFHKVGDISTNKLIAKDIEALQNKVEKLDGQWADHIKEKVQPWLDQFNINQHIDNNRRALVTASNIYNHFAEGINDN